MGEAEINTSTQKIIIHSVFFFYGDAANDTLSKQVAKDISDHWNATNGKAVLRNRLYDVSFNIEGHWAKNLTPETVFKNTNPRNNYFRIENFSGMDISFADGIGSNTGYFKLDNLLNRSTTAAHEYGHTIGLPHPPDQDIRGNGRPGIMYPRGTIVDAAYQYNPAAAPLEPGGTVNPFTRKVLQEDINNLQLKKLDFSRNKFAMLGGFTSRWHDQHVLSLESNF